MVTKIFSEKQTYFGFKIITFKNDCMAHDIAKTGYHALDEVVFLEKLLSKIPEAICFDVGANIGLHTMVMCKNSAQVYSFEPQKKTAEIFTKNIEINNISNCNFNNFGLGNIKEKATMFICKGNNGGSSLINDKLQTENVPKEHITSATVDIKRGDQVVSDYNIQRVDIIKIDVEGFEAEVILGLKDTIYRDNPIVLLEWNNDNTRKNFQQFDILKKIFPNYEYLTWSYKPYISKTNISKTNISKRKYKLLRSIAKRKTKFFNNNEEAILWDQAYSCIVLGPKNKMTLIRDSLKEAKWKNWQYNKFLDVLFR